jgi:hypothetical protein
MLGTVVTSGTVTANMVQEEPNSAREAETSVDMELDKNSEEGITTDEYGDLVDYNEDGTAAAVEAAAKEDRLKDLRELFVTKGKEYR